MPAPGTLQTAPLGVHSPPPPLLRLPHVQSCSCGRFPRSPVHACSPDPHPVTLQVPGLRGRDGRDALSSDHRPLAAAQGACRNPVSSSFRAQRSFGPFPPWSGRVLVGGPSATRSARSSFPSGAAAPADPQAPRVREAERPPCPPLTPAHSPALSVTGHTRRVAHGRPWGNYCIPWTVILLCILDFNVWVFIPTGLCLRIRAGPTEAWTRRAGGKRARLLSLGETPPLGGHSAVCSQRKLLISHLSLPRLFPRLRAHERQGAGLCLSAVGPGASPWGCVCRKRASCHCFSSVETSEKGSVCSVGPSLCTCYGRARPVPASLCGLLGLRA